MHPTHRRFTDRYPLRVTIVVILLTLVALALVGSGVLSTTIMRGYLVDKVDTQLAQLARSGPGMRRFEGPPPGAAGLPSLFVAQVFNADGTPGRGFQAPLREGESKPQLPSLTYDQVLALRGEPFNVSATSGGDTWRVLAVPRNNNTTIMVAQNLHDVNRTVQRLVGVQAAAGVILLVLLAGVGTYVVRRSLRGLEDVEHTAVAIAGGQLGRRVPERDPRTEVGRLSLALNQMLGQIENAFAQRSASELAARQSEDRMRRFVADASHELRTPLTSIRGFAELSRQRGGEVEPDVMRRIEDEAKRMGLLVDDLLLLARLDQQRPLRLETVDLLPIAADALHNAQAVQPDRSISLKILPGSEAPVVQGDEARLRQVLGNLISNALHHTPADAPILVSVGTRGREAVLEVQDSGPGLTAEQKARVFERFYRADSARTRGAAGAGGSGLGLSIVAALVAAHGGRVTITDTTPHGATFTVTLPLPG
ncbi:HAMP domain-containing histidine kinase [Kribbella sandramycini]|uniref:histidine kinase n=1 Tax=Kribbella sandramycini TaxID=60450 RepID=A0A7Y4NZF1_9ACTN|nr:HAMP domain-containing sensor histidine kinase [Kribbella sandramycini]MBB6569374.1 two-component system OmpR family sensor kinase [Kribbella sandramycini]NOL40788.1 HAMP domain-containing histidine kinase [Kribbella sandramycini]